MFVRALAKDEGDPIKAIETYLLDRGWPDDRRFATAFVEFPLYQRGYTREVLETRERARGHKEPATYSPHRLSMFCLKRSVILGWKHSDRAQSRSMLSGSIVRVI
jgi:hypothetical protein